MEYLYMCVISLFNVIGFDKAASFQIENGETYTYNPEERVIENLLNRVNRVTKHSRPVGKDNGTVDVRMTISLIHILDFDEKNQVLSTMIWKSLQWQDKRLSWDPIDYGGIELVAIPPTSVWTPDIVLYNREVIDTDQYDSMDMRVAEVDRYWLLISSNGDCEWIPAIVHKSVCHVDMENFPYDTQKCDMKFGSWAYDEMRMNLTLNPETNGLDLSSYTASMEWTLSNAEATRNSVKYECCPETFVDITYTFSLVRNSPFYTQFLIMPVVLLSGMVITIFWIPPTRPDRTGLGMSLFASFMLLLLLVVQISPPSKSIKLVTYCCFNIILIAVSTFLSALVVNFCQSKRPFPKCLLKCTMLAPYFQCQKGEKNIQRTFNECHSKEDTFCKRSDIKNHTKATTIKLNEPELEIPPVSNNELWQSLALILDRIFFVVYLTLSVILAAAYLPRPDYLNW